ncbi:MAG TPA: hypothetical protein PLV06_07755 [Bacteroidales bacterium]|nr:hypothetical protein [Bacteroidales bacterium]HPJ60224.1 hypothetical protein [Bacteroidales bacterium]HPR12261.1 hypothetical protein [Bacteroidales bacterium]HRW83889.1 hypothetical protein [Bacteroidales bacterium]
MKKTVFLLSVILLAVCTVTTQAQKNRTLSHGFSVNWIIGIPPANYGLSKNANPDDDVKILFTTGIQIGNRWYFGSSERFKMGLMVNWLDITAGTRKNGDLIRAVADVSFFEIGPIATVAFSDEIALDSYYNLRPTGFAHMWAYSGDDPTGYAGGGISHAIGTAFRWKVLSVGLEYQIANINCEYSETDYEYPDQKLTGSNFRLMIGAKF